MNADALAHRIRNRVLLLDGATGTELQRRGMPPGVCPEMWVLEHPGVIQEIQEAYFEAGSDAVFAFTFGATRPKLREYGHVDESIPHLNERLVQLSRRIAPAGRLVAGDIASTGRLVAPFGPCPFEEAVDVFKQQVTGLEAGGADFLIIETMMDIQEARAALIAALETCDLPVMVTMTFEPAGRTLTGTPPDAAAVILENLGAFAVGCNCSTGPDEMVDVVKQMRSIAGIPIIAKPNAGLPEMRDGETAFTMDPATFSEKTNLLVEAGAGIVGGCCGTTPEHIADLAARLPSPPPAAEEPLHLCLASPQRMMSPERQGALTIIGERINPTGKKRLQSALREGNLEMVRALAAEQAASGAAILDVNVGMPGIDEAATLRSVAEMLSVATDVPLCFDSSDPRALAAALRTYPGRAMVNSISAEREKLDRVLPLAAKYGAAIIILPVSDRGVPETAAQRAAIASEVFSRAETYGYTKSDVLIDGLVMTISSSNGAARETLETVAWASRDFGTHTVLGLSNVSFGLPQRRWLNAAFLAMAVARGLSMVIANPGEPTLAAVRLAAEALAGRDPSCLKYIEGMQHLETPPAARPPATDPGQAARDAVVNGDRDGIEARVRRAREAGISPFDLVHRHLIPALQEVGARFEKKVIFLPQLLLSAEAMDRAFVLLAPELEAADASYRGRVVIATVKGDIHDIGKNIVALMLRNHGFEVIDLGKDVAAERIVDVTEARNADLIMLSALMTTTMTQMATTVQQARAHGVSVPIVVGGAVVNDRFAEEIGADGYAADAVGAVKLARELVKAPRSSA